MNTHHRKEPITNNDLACCKFPDSLDLPFKLFHARPSPRAVLAMDASR